MERSNLPLSLMNFCIATNEEGLGAGEIPAHFVDPLDNGGILLQESDDIVVQPDIEGECASNDGDSYEYPYDGAFPGAGQIYDLVGHTTEKTRMARFFPDLL
jgi:hypothetical protein